ncbi:MAG: hypothetical protein AAFP86_18685 [Planctomycetota bacterium]
MPEFLNGLLAQDETMPLQPATMSDDALAFEELKLLQAIIARQDDYKGRTKAIAITLFSASTGLYANGTLVTTAGSYFILAATILLLFGVLESFYGATEIKAENRAKQVEEWLRERKGAYDGPRIAESMLASSTPSSIVSSFMRWRTIWWYAPLLVLSAFIAGTLQPNAGGRGTEQIGEELRPEADAAADPAESADSGAEDGD